MKQLGLIFIGLFLISMTFGQTLKIQAGSSLSKLDWEINSINLEPPYNKTLLGYSIFAGLDYIDKKFFNLSSNIGFLSKGGKGEITFTDENGVPTGSTTTAKPTLNYISINTFIDIKYPIIEKISPFISIGPRFDYLVSYSKEFDGLNDIDALKKYNFGLLLGGGVKYDLSKIQIGLRADYYLNFIKIGDWPAKNGNLGGKVIDKTLTLNLTIGYKLK
jgi:opacity protein-like surface antigen